ncbi:hypothetical protein RND81_13G083100 [Saponaria officinalis]|uniref:B3 domain-containing protein n=1 Tax=Saponaria officinalis TaxID=3572 RepID=A0AAW1GV74_SAPOF
MMEFVSIADFREDELKTIEFLNPLDMLAMVAHKALEKDYPSSLINEINPTIVMPMSEHKKLPFDLNLKPRTHRKPRSTPIDVQALFPCLYRPTNYFMEIGSSRPQNKRGPTKSMESGSSQPPKKRRLIDPPLPQPLNPELPVEYRQKIVEMGGSDVQFVTQKRLYDADVDTTKSRLTMPYRQCAVHFGKVGKTEVRVIHMDGNELREMMMIFFRWDSVSSYVFNGSWNDLVSVNGLKKNSVVHVWSFKLADEFAFALVKL